MTVAYKKSLQEIRRILKEQQETAQWYLDMRAKQKATTSIASTRGPSDVSSAMRTVTPYPEAPWGMKKRDTKKMPCPPESAPPIHVIDEFKRKCMLKRQRGRGCFYPSKLRRFEDPA